MQVRYKPQRKSIFVVGVPNKLITLTNAYISFGWQQKWITNTLVRTISLQYDHEQSVYGYKFEDRQQYNNRSHIVFPRSMKEFSFENSNNLNFS